jgi:hypothetical protein
VENTNLNRENFARLETEWSLYQKEAMVKMKTALK